VQLVHALVELEQEMALRRPLSQRGKLPIALWQMGVVDVPETVQNSLQDQLVE
jgi:hypothetical protein